MTFEGLRKFIVEKNETRVLVRLKKNRPNDFILNYCLVSIVFKYRNNNSFCKPRPFVPKNIERSFLITGKNAVPSSVARGGAMGHLHPQSLPFADISPRPP